MKAAARRLLEQFESAPEKVNSLERPYEASGDVIPVAWTPEHCCKRIVEAFETLAKLPRVTGPKPFGNAWPDYQDDKNATVGLTQAEQLARQRAQNRTVLRATGIDIKRMEIVFDWLDDLRQSDEDVCRVVQAWGSMRAAGINIKDACREDGRSFQAFYRCRDKGVAAIVSKLNATSVPVF